MLPLEFEIAFWGSTIVVYLLLVGLGLALVWRARVRLTPFDMVLWTLLFVAIPPVGLIAWLLFGASPSRARS